MPTRSLKMKINVSFLADLFQKLTEGAASSPAENMVLLSIFTSSSYRAIGESLPEEDCSCPHCTGVVQHLKAMEELGDDLVELLLGAMHSSKKISKLVDFKLIESIEEGTEKGDN